MRDPIIESESHLLPDMEARNRIASEWMHQGIELLNANTPASLREAVRCFDRAIALRETLPISTYSWYRYVLMAGWMNRGDALSRLDGADNLTEALISYDEALMLSFGLPLEENILFPRRVAIAWINRGFTLQRDALPVNHAEAAQCFREGLAILAHPTAAKIPDRALLQAGAWINLASSLLEISPSSASKARSAAKEALDVLKPIEQLDVTAAETSLKARHTLCRAVAQELAHSLILPEDAVTEALDATDEGLALARFWEKRGEEKLAPFVPDLFCFGCHLYQIHRPQFLPEFILEQVEAEQGCRTVAITGKMFRTAHTTLHNAFREMVRGDFALGTAQFERSLGTLQNLRNTQDRLADLMRARDR